MRSEKIINIWAFVILLFGSVAMLVPFVWSISTSLKDQKNIFQMPPKWIPDPATIQHYIDVWKEVPLLSGFINTLIVVVFVLVIGIFTSTMAAYAFAKIAFPFKETIFLALLGTMMIPFAVVMIPQFIMFSKLDWVDTLLPLILPGLFGNIVTVFFLRQFLQSALPDELIDASKIDGSGFTRTFFTIVLPVAKPAIAAQAALGFMGIWNDFLGPLIYLHSPEKQTLQVVIASMQAQYMGSSNYPLILAASIISMIPCVVIFLIAQKHFVQSLAISGIKG
ncbi:carbohydrate ABC transporter permease [Lederbergia sp. NSJ-179]|uniref:carbohydrate ABC transporter permease n=1 Tax=Lederbergia sp. NSJ-179 TaxID=2931402 RepID=UPI001FD40CB7|nr:carbohydrate ABC transporter permease [Lederbergia sp. NSJ-179]MCJ7842887.1 carbohydrate ABC transporter permease [Lederbergia sp. NSJ-179]